MPTSAELIAVVAGAVGQEESRVATNFRSLREDGQIGAGGRGRNALSLTLVDATRVLVAALISGEARDAAGTVAALYGWKGAIQEERPRERLHSTALDALRPAFFGALAHRAPPRPATFGATVDRLMAALASDRLTPAAASGDYLRRAEVARLPPSHDQPFARLELRGRLRGSRFEAEGASIAFGRRYVYAVSLGFRPPERFRRQDGTVDASRAITLAELMLLIEGSRGWT